MKTPIYQYYNSAPFLIFWILLLTSLNGVTGHCCFDCSIYIYYEKLIEKYRIDFGRSLTLSTLIRKLRVGSRFYMLASHCPEIDTRWPYEYGILNFARRWPRTWSTANEQRKQVRCQQKVTRWHPNHTRRQHEDVNFYSSLYPQDTRRPHDGYTTSYWEYDALELEHEGVTWPPDGIKLSAVGNSVADRRHDDNNN